MRVQGGMSGLWCGMLGPSCGDDSVGRGRLFAYVALRVSGLVCSQRGLELGSHVRNSVWKMQTFFHNPSTILLLQLTSSLLLCCLTHTPTTTRHSNSHSPTHCRAQSTRIAELCVFYLMLFIIVGIVSILLCFRVISWVVKHRVSRKLRKERGKNKKTTIGNAQNNGCVCVIAKAHKPNYLNKDCNTFSNLSAAGSSSFLRPLSSNRAGSSTVESVSEAGDSARRWRLRVGPEP